MKKLFIYFSVAILSCIMLSCEKDKNDNSQNPGTVEFAFQNVATSKQKAGIEVTAAAVVVSIQDLSGKLLYNNERVELYNMNGSYISKPLSLIPGSYKLTKYLVVDALNNVLYATPLEGSKNAYLVKDALPINFGVSKNNTTKVVPEVLSTKQSTPEDFGYATFSFDIVKTFDFLIAVFAYNENTKNFELTTAHLTVTSDSLAYSKDIAAATDTVTLKDGNKNYILTITKDGYQTWVDTLSTADLKLYFSSADKGPLKVVLNKIENNYFELTTVIDSAYSVYFGLHTSDSSSFVVDWGDGIINTYPKTKGHISLSHNYSSKGEYRIKTIGALVSVDQFETWDGPLQIINNQVFKDIDITKLINLKGLTISGDKHIIENISISKNINLETIMLGSNNLNNIDITNNKKLRLLNIGSPLIDSAKVNSIIHCLLNSVIENPRKGQIMFWLGSLPSGQGKLDIQTLVNIYGWQQDINLWNDLKK